MKKAVNTVLPVNYKVLNDILRRTKLMEKMIQFFTFYFN